ncbi:hypothetical protein [Roseimicrobium sp. ORNL1]|uniref:hypothetical protein n=1 Tax=Roseimicrobium sp. ORNL1 TaxID=2711231 RepID=UPI0013E124FB|nr:hypothetical protein [Roseimicrobium sp. ORNL1]QIF03020.1 hypothetical protein G5S37_16320 [Roseimicrobium sp. ORNL1]
MSKLAKGTGTPAFLVTLAFLIIGILALLFVSDSVVGALFFLPFSLGPLLVSLLLAAISPSKSSQKALITGSVLYAAWFTYMYLEVFHWHPDPQGAIAMLFVGVLSLPVMIPVWIISLVVMRRQPSQDSVPQDGERSA